MKSCYEWKFQQKNVYRKNDCYELLLHYYYITTTCTAWTGVSGTAVEAALERFTLERVAEELERTVDELLVPTTRRVDAPVLLRLT